MTPKILRYPEKDMELAIDAVSVGTPVATATRRFGVPRSTLDAKIKGKHPTYEVTIRASQNQVKNRADVTSEKLKGWFSEVESTLADIGAFDRLKDPSRFFS